MEKFKPKYLSYLRAIPIIWVIVTVLASFVYLKRYPMENEIIVLAIGFLICLAACLSTMAVVTVVAKRDLPSGRPMD